MSLSPLVLQQCKFSALLGKLLVYASERKFHVTMGDCYRNPVLQTWYQIQGKSWTPNSRHLSRLAVDLNLFLPNGDLAAAEDYEPLAAFWESLDKDCVAGLRWSQVDAGHFELKPPIPKTTPA